MLIAHRKHAYVPTIIGVIPFCRPNGTCNPLLYLAKEAEMELTFLNAEVATLSAQYFRVINYTNLMNQPETYARPISRFLRLSHQSEDHLTTRLRTGITKNHTSRPTPPDTSLDFLDDFFTVRRDQQWSVLGGNAFDIEALDRLNITGTGESELDYNCL